MIISAFLLNMKQVRFYIDLPANTLMNTVFTLGSDSRIFRAADTWDCPTPPPRSRKFAGLPPFKLIRSIVAIASPAPFTIHPMLPSISM